MSKSLTSRYYVFRNGSRPTAAENPKVRDRLLVALVAFYHHTGDIPEAVVVHRSRTCDLVPEVKEALRGLTAADFQAALAQCKPAGGRPLPILDDARVRVLATRVAKLPVQGTGGCLATEVWLATEEET